MKKIKYLVFMIPILFGFINTVNAASYVPTEFSFIGKSGPGAVWVSPGNNSYGDIHTIMSDITQTTKFLNVVIATSTSVSSDTFKFGGVNFEANYSYMLMPGRKAVVDGYELNVYVIQLSYGYGNERGCSVSGTTCYNYGVGWFYNRMDYNVVWSVLDVYNSDELLDTSSSAVYEKVDNILQDVGQVNDKLDNIEDTITDDSSPDLGALENSAGWLPAGPVDSILNLPLSLLNNLSSTLNKSCNSVILTLPYVNKTITLPCITDLYDKMGVTGTIFNWAGIIAAAFILYNYLLKLYKWVDDTLTMRENNLPGYFDDNWGGGA